MIENTDIAAIRREYSLKILDEKNVAKNPFIQFSIWMEETIKSGIIDPSAMILATAGSSGIPSLRTVLLKSMEADGLVFFTNYESRKAKELDENPNASILFLWKELERQIRISGRVIKVSHEQSEEYFHSRPYESQLGAWASEQSKIIPDREYLNNRFNEFKEKFNNEEIPLPPFWGGYKLLPGSFEFWQGRESRLHDRIIYSNKNGEWKINRLAP